MATIDAVLARARAAAPQRIAVREWDSGRCVTYAQLDDWASAVAGHVLAVAAPGARVALHLPNSAAFLAGAFGAFRAGAVAAYVNYRLTAEEAERQMRLAEARIVVTTAERAAQLADSAALAGVSFIAADAAASAPRRLAWPDLLAAAHAPVAPPEGRDDADALLRFTSGSTGAPKGVLVSHRAWLLRALSILAEEARVQDGETTMVMGPLSHHAGLYVLPTMLRGGTLLVFHHFDVEAIGRAVGEVPVRRTQMVPTMLRILLDAPQTMRAMRRSGLGEILHGGSPIERGVLERAFDLLPDTGFIQVYGSHEAGSISVLDAASHRDPDLMLSAGRPLLPVEVRVAPGADGEAWGEIEVRAPWTPRARLTEAGRVPVTEDFVPTGDLGELRDGFIFLKDRAHGVIVSGGFNVYPMEVEAVINRCPGIVTSAVVAAPDERWGERVVAFVVARDAEVVRSGALREHCRRLLANFKVPKEFRLTENIPVNPNGKPDRRRLGAPLWDGRDRRIN